MSREIFENGYIRAATAVPEVFIGDIDKNCSEIIKYCIDANKNSVDIIVFPELSVTGYTSQDLFLNSDFLKKCFFSQKI